MVTVNTMKLSNSNFSVVGRHDDRYYEIFHEKYKVSATCREQQQRKNARSAMAKRENPNMSHSDFNSMASHTSHSTSTNRKYYGTHCPLIEAAIICSMGSKWNSLKWASNASSGAQIAFMWSINKMKRDDIFAYSLNLHIQIASMYNLTYICQDIICKYWLRF
ncbi:hypothetical protein CAPTEDRAFT_195277 [Capitella teleta]|uniref:Uncharacterized protein n=1 Tax=Capitella teleta TaxID=283909 RepID=R7VAG2_CAPTE|nr:hypothetical protein CAPTEDRAFT_195277 [Capitella teleta]|eukprot:ELU13326.1 hypothetical protein CAPTEDRAFT_195277 [Capitella teleta]